MNPSDEVWNRAALEGGGSKPQAGDRALAGLLLAHGLAMNGGDANGTQQSGAGGGGGSGFVDSPFVAPFQEPGVRTGNGLVRIIYSQ